MFGLLSAVALTVAIGEPGYLDPPENQPPEMITFGTYIEPGNTLVVHGHVMDEDLTGVTIYIDWLGVQYSTTVIDFTSGYWEWFIGLGPVDEGWVSAIAYDSEGLSSSQEEDFVKPNP